MPHILNMPLLYQEKLNRANTAHIGYKVLMYVRGFEITNFIGNWQYNKNQTENHCFDVTKAIKNTDIVIAKSIPELPTFDGEGSITQFSNLKLQLQKIGGDFWQYVGSGAGITRLTDSSVEVSATCEGMPDLPLFKGKIRQNPKEEFDSVTFDVRASMWDIVGRELKTNLYGTVAYTYPNSGIVTEITNSYTAVTSPKQRLTFHHPIITFNEIGESKIICKASDSSIVDILQVYTLPDKEASLGKYTINFLSASTLEFITPKTGVTVITFPTIITTGVLDVLIPTSVQDATGIWKVSMHVTHPNPTAFPPVPFNDIKGKNLEFHLAYTVHGNPISIALDLLIRTITGNWNTTAAPPLDISLPINYAIFEQMESLFDFSTVYVSEWNTDNDVFSFRNDSKPIQAKNIVQKILDHVGCQLTYDTEGKISVNSNWFYNDPIKLWRLGSVHCGAIGTQFTSSHSIETAKEYKRMELTYGYNPFTKNSNGKIEKFAPDALIGVYGANDKPTTYNILLPYYKTNVSDLIVDMIAQYLWKWVQVSYIRLHATVLPQFGLSLDVGDKFIADFKTSPILPNEDKGIGKYFMIYGINKKAGGEVQIECIATPEPIIPAKWCEAKWCMGARWK